MVKILDMVREEVVQSVRKGKITICVVGLGYVGLPLAVLFAKEGAQVIGCDCDEELIKKVNQGQTSVKEHDISVLQGIGAETLEVSCPNCGVHLFKFGEETFCPSCGRLATVTGFGVHLEDVVTSSHEKIVESRQSLEDLLNTALETGKLSATTRTESAVRQSDVILETVGTPITEVNVPKYGDLEDSGRAVGKGLQKNSLVILKSTVSPGITENMLKPLLESESGLKAGRDFGLAFMPETIKEGHAIFEFRTLPRVVGGITKRCARSAANIFSVFPAPVYVYESTSVVEAAKLFMNIYRDVNIALANEFALICEELGVDVIQAINAANIDPKTRLLTPGLVGGYCLPKDTYHLSYPSEKAGYFPNLIMVARQLNNSLPNHILELVDEVFKALNVPTRDAVIGVLGLGFKANSGDLRNTPAKPIVDGLFDRGALVVAHDPFVEYEAVRRIMPQLICKQSIEAAIEKATCTVIVTDHLEYRGLTAGYLKSLMSFPCAIVDARHIIDPIASARIGVVFRGLGKRKIRL